MLGNEYWTEQLQIATVVVPVAVYFLILGFLNSRRCPQLLSGRRDFALLVVALCPLFVLPALGYVGISPFTVGIAVVAVAGCIYALAPRGHTWVIYNLPLPRAIKLTENALQDAGAQVRRNRNGFDLPAVGGRLEIHSFSLLHNVSIRLQGGDVDLAGRFEASLRRELAAIRSEATPAATAMLLVATAMLVAPLALVAYRADEIVRILTDLLN